MLSKEAKDKLIEESMRFVYYIAKQYHITNPDVIQEGMVALCEAASKFDPSRGFEFLTFAGKKIRWALINSNKREQMGMIRIPRNRPDLKIQCISLDMPVGEDDNGNTLIDLIPSEVDAYERFMQETEVGETMETLKSILTDKEMQVVELKLEGFNQRQIGKKLNNSQAHISRTIGKVRAKFEDFRALAVNI